ncbi:MAG: hypothetical protein N2376_00690 [Clostridia bacterium]|nr:hypothetical protein [Clostridia bacterium]
METKNSLNWKMVKIVPAAIILAIVGIILISLNYLTNKDAEGLLRTGSVEIKAMYGGTFSYKDIASIELRDILPEVTEKTNGAWLGDNKKGYFTVTGLGECLLQVQTNQGPFIFVKLPDKYLIMNYADSKKTEAVYNGLLKGWQGQ